MKAVTYAELDVPSWTATSPESTHTYRFAIPSAYLDSGIDAIPSIDSISFTPQRIALGESMGQRASLKVSFRDHKHVFASEAYDSGTFFGKWRGRYGNKLRGSPLRLYRGVVGQAIADMEVRYYVVDACNGPLQDGSYIIEAKDPLKYADDDRAQAPSVSYGSLAGSITAVAVTAILSPSGIGDATYPASGHVCLGGKEIVSYTRVSDTLTIVRGQLGTTAAAHDAAERVQQVLRYTGNDVADIIYDLLVNYASVPTQYIDLAEWQTETADNMGSVLYAANIADPTSVRKLVNELIQQAVLAIYWDDRTGKIKLRVIREIATDTATFTDNEFIEGSFQVTEQADKRLSQVWAYYTQRNPTDNGAKEDNYKNILAEVDLDRERQYGGSMIRKMQCRWIQTLTAASRYTGTQLTRYRDPPRAYAFDLISGSFVQPAGGYTIQWWGEQDETGAQTTVPIQITCVTFYADRIHVEAEEMLVTGQAVATNVVFLTAGSGTFARPATWNDANNSISSLAGGAGGNSGNTSAVPAPGVGGGGSAFAKINNYALAASESYQTGTGGAGAVGVAGSTVMGSDGVDSWFASTGTLLCKAGDRGTGGLTGGAGGQAAACVGDLTYSGGNGGSILASALTATSGTGGGSAAGPHGAGAGGGIVASAATAGAGGGGADGGSVGGSSLGAAGANGGANRFGFGRGNSTTPTGQEGGGGKGSDAGTSNGGAGGTGEQIWTQTIAPITSAGPGGGGGGGSNTGPGLNGGSFGGGGGGARRGQNGGNGADGIQVLTWQI
jgi:hypothetical protein